MNPKDLQYLNKVNDASQYAVKRCEQGAFMFHRTTSQGSEVMNAVNIEVCHKVAVCPINTCILLTNTESRHYERQKKSAWAQTNDLTPRGEKEYNEVFDGVNYGEFSIIIVERDQSWECSVKRLNTMAWKHTVSLPKEPTRGPYFGKCTCGLVTRDAVPCEHMAAVVCSSRIAGLNRQNIMPFWWTTTQWQEQFPQEVKVRYYTNMEVIRANYEADDSMRYCPSWSAPNKAGRLSKGKRKLSALEKSQGKKKKPKPLTRFCQICRGFSHQTIDCWHQERNRQHRTKEWIAKGVAIEEAMIISADPVPIWPGFQMQESEEDVDKEKSNEDVDEDEEFDEINDETTLSAGGGEGESQEQEEGTED
jgi:hypothetical protein